MHAAVVTAFGSAPRYQEFATPIPAGADEMLVDVLAAGLHLRQRVRFKTGQDVLVLGATGSAGQMAVQIAKLFGANNVIAAGRHAGRLAALPALGATAAVLLDGDADDIADRLGQAAADVHVVVDYLW
jgi:NADPH:quinone reductase-like Zn-dependent oxidoreductase